MDSGRYRIRSRKTLRVRQPGDALNDLFGSSGSGLRQPRLRKGPAPSISCPQLGGAQIPVGYFGPADPDHPVGGALWRGAQLAVEQVNQTGGYRGTPYKLVPAWDENPWSGGASVVVRLAYQEEVWGYPVPSKPEEIGDTVTTRHFHFDVIHTPGHCDDHICLFEKSKDWLFSGDLFVTTQPKVVRPEENQWQIIASLKKVKDLMPRVLFPAPGSRIVTDPVPALEEIIRYLEDLGREVIELSNKGLPPDEIRQQIFGDEAPLAELTQQQFSSLNLVKSYLKENN